LRLVAAACAVVAADHLDLATALAAGATVELAPAKSPQPRNSSGNIGETLSGKIAKCRQMQWPAAVMAGNWHHIIPAERNYNEEACSA
jgi:hypothetical protein